MKHPVCVFRADRGGYFHLWNPRKMFESFPRVSQLFMCLIRDREMFEGDFADICHKKVQLMLMA